jgi:hypothetical protein
MRNGGFLDVMLKYPSDGEGEDSSLKRNRSNKFNMLVYPCCKERAL